MTRAWRKNFIHKTAKPEPFKAILARCRAGSGEGEGCMASGQLLTSDRQPSTASACEAEAAAGAGAVSHQVTFMRNDAGLEQGNGIDASARAQRAVATRLRRIEGVLST